MKISAALFLFILMATFFSCSSTPYKYTRSMGYGLDYANHYLPLEFTETNKKYVLPHMRPRLFQNEMIVLIFFTNSLAFKKNPSIPDSRPNDEKGWEEFRQGIKKTASNMYRVFNSVRISVYQIEKNERKLILFREATGRDFKAGNIPFHSEREYPYLAFARVPIRHSFLYQFEIELESKNPNVPAVFYEVDFVVGKWLPVFDGF